MSGNYKHKDNEKLLNTWADTNKIDAVITAYNELHKDKSSDNNEESESTKYFGGSSSLNEDTNTNTDKRIPIDLSEIYKLLITDLTRRMNIVLDEFDPKNMVNLAETKQTMEDLIKAADETIKNKIQIITKANASPAASKESGLGAAAIQFLAGHPVEANNLTEVWSRHLGDLKMRMNNRIKIMTD